MKMNKKAQLGGETILWFYRFTLLIIVILGIIVIVNSNFSKKYDVRPAEAVILSGKIIDCVSENGVVNLDSLYNFENCFSLNKNEFYIRAKINSLDSDFYSAYDFGNKDLEPLCEAKEKGTEAKVSCLKQDYYILLKRSTENMLKEKAKLELLIGVKKVDKNV